MLKQTKFKLDDAVIMSDTKFKMRNNQTKTFCMKRCTESSARCLSFHITI